MHQTKEENPVTDFYNLAKEIILKNGIKCLRLVGIENSIAFEHKDHGLIDIMTDNGSNIICMSAFNRSKNNTVYNQADLESIAATMLSKEAVLPAQDIIDLIDSVKDHDQWQKGWKFN